jgi:hypothetical protein
MRFNFFPNEEDAIFAKEGRKVLLPATTATTNDEKKRVL